MYIDSNLGHLKFKCKFLWFGKSLTFCVNAGELMKSATQSTQYYKYADNVGTAN